MDLLEDGTRIPYPYDFHDVQRGEFCYPQTWSDGATYCTPNFTQPVYRDADCTQMFVRRPPSFEDISYTADLFVAQTGDVQISKLRSIGAPTSASQYFRKRGNQCMPGMDPGGTFFELGDTTFGSDQFVRTKKLADSTDDRLAQIRIYGDDGLVVPDGFHDNELGLDCTITGTEPCLPWSSAPAAYFSNNACTERTYPAAYASADSVYVPGAGCGTYYGATTIPATALYDGGPGNCVLAMPGDTYYMAGPPLALATHERIAMPSTTRFTRYQIGDQIDTVVHDNVLDVDCTVDIAGCYPSTVPVQHLFADAGCTQALDVASVPDASCGDPPTFAGDEAGFHRIAAQRTAPVYTISTGDTCMPTSVAGEHYFELLAPIALDQFGTATFSY
ncbi:MAG TPA: hypothetical protein VGC41_29830 [Kofleriaceae bacterium]